ncbi:MAG: hypothetical protein OXF94_13385, partial [Gammaproteobacteria bacterium]|nr:hypothetical protein [Gammaproteobacteria bacterium]
MSENVFPLPGPFRAQRIVEMQGALHSAEALFPSATRKELRATDAANDPRLYDRGRDFLGLSYHSIVLRTPGLT